MQHVLSGAVVLLKNLVGATTFVPMKTEQESSVHDFVEFLLVLESLEEAEGFQGSQAR